MAVLKNKSDDALLKNLVPLNTLSDKQLGKLLSRVVTQKAKKGEYLFREGDTDHQNVYLLSGIVALLSGPKEMDMVASGTPTARFALAHQLPRKHSARAKTAVTYVRVDSRMLSDLLARSQSSSYEVTEVSAPGRNDWMSLLLQSSVFQQIPPANLQQVMMRMREINVSAGDVIISQGGEGDYFYLISRGMCRVTRQPASDRPPVELAQLKAGQGFGEEALISNNPRSSTVTMLSDGVLVRLNKKDFVELVKQPLSRTIEYAEACDLVDGGNLWLDVRIPEEYEAGHLPGAINMPFFSLRFQASSLASDRTYLIYGNEVGQAATAAYLLVERGYEVFILSQGWHEVAVLSGLEVPELKPPVDNVIDFNRDLVSIADVTEGIQDTEQAQEAIKALQKQLKDAERAYGEALTQHHSELDLLKQALDMAKQKLELREQEARVAEESLGEEVAQLRDFLAQTQAQAQEMEVHQAEVVESEGKLRERVSELEAQLESAKQHHGQLQSMLEEELQAVRQQLDGSIASLQQQEQLTKEQEDKQAQQLARLQQQYESAQEETEQFRCQASDDLNGLRRERDALQQSLQELQEKFDAAEQESGERQLQVEAEISSIGQKLDDTQNRLHKAESARAELEQSRQQLQDQWSSSESVLNNALAEAGERADRLDAELQRVGQAREAEEADYRQHRLELEAGLAEAVEEKSGLLEVQQSLHQELHTLHLEATELKTEKARQELALQEAAESRERLSSGHTAVRDELRLERQEKAELENALQSTEERRAGLQKELDALRRAGDNADAQHQNTLDALRAELEQTRESLLELRSSKQQLESARDESESALNFELTEATTRIEQLEAELQSLSEAWEQEQQNNVVSRQTLEETTIRSEGLQQDLKQLRKELVDGDARHQDMLDSLREELASSQARAEASQEALEEARAEAKRLDERQMELEARLEQEHQTAEFLRRSLETAEDAIEISETESQEELKAVSEQLAGRQTSLDQLDTAKHELEQQLQDVQGDLQEKEQLLAEAEKAHRQLIEELEQRLVAANEETERAFVEQRQRETELQSELEGGNAVKAELETRLAEVEGNLQSLLETHTVEDANKQQTIRQLEQALAESKESLEGASQSQTESRVAEQALQAAHLEITQLNSTIEGLREVQLEMESQLAEDAEDEIKALRTALENEEKKRRKAEESARQIDVLRRERAVQETAVEMLGEEMEGLEAEKEALLKEKDSLIRQLTERQGQLSELIEENNQLQTEKSGFREQAEDSGLADDLLTQLEAMRSKVEISQRDRDKAKDESVRMKREVRELRSVIETYVEQIQDVQSFGAGDELIALRSELDMVRRQATGDLEQMRQQLSAVEAKERDQGNRDVSDAASLQALRQEVDTSQMALSEKEHLLRMSQTQCRTLEDAIEDRDKENDELRRKLELLLRKTGGLGLGSGALSRGVVSDSQLLFEDTAPPSSSFREGLSRASADAGNAKQSTKFGRLFRKK